MTVRLFTGEPKRATRIIRNSDQGLSQLLGQKRNAALAPEAMGAIEHLMLHHIAGAEDLIDGLHLRKAGVAAGDGEDSVARARFGEKRSRGYEAGDVIHLGPVE